MLTNLLNQTAVYWALEGRDRYGAETFADPVLVDCRWSYNVAESVDAEGQKFMSTVSVLTKVPLALGSCVELSDDLEAVRPVENIIRSTSKGETIRKDEILYLANL